MILLNILKAFWQLFLEYPALAVINVLGVALLVYVTIAAIKSDGQDHSNHSSEK